jgi:glycerophosphoryl diester phosphodiesterase
MNRMKTKWLSLLLVWSLSTVASSCAELSTVEPLGRAHAHNDYEHARPLLDALDCGFCSVEADVWLVKGELLVAHDLRDAKPGRTLEALYLRPLAERVKTNRGRVFRSGQSFTLMVDLKSDATNTYVALRPVLERYQSMLTRFSSTQTQTNAVMVILSGNRPRGLMAAEPSRLAAYDGRLEDLDTDASIHLIPLVSDNWTRHFSWGARTGEGPFPSEQRRKLTALVERTHRQGRRIRWWGAPDNSTGWSELESAGVDLINTDDLQGLQKFFKNTAAK